MEHLLYQQPIEYIVSTAITKEADKDLENGIHEHCFHILGGDIKYRAFRDRVGYGPHNTGPDNIKYGDEDEIPMPPHRECIKGIQDTVSLYFTQYSATSQFLEAQQGSPRTGQLRKGGLDTLEEEPWH
jgi:hypothetical protein